MPLVTVEENPYNAETPLADLNRGITPTDLFFVRSHFDVPTLDPASYRLTLDGDGPSPMGFSLRDLKAFPPREVTVTLECAGNGRTRLDPPVPGVRWAYGAAGTARFAGTSLSCLLDRAGAGGGAVEVLFVGADRGEVEPGRVVSFQRSLPLPVARHPDTILAWEMNGEPLTRLHGSPLRLVVPRWYAVASVKWLTHVRLLREPFRGHYQDEKYVYEKEAGTPDGTPVTTLRARAIIASPGDGEHLPHGALRVAGMAWSGVAPVQCVEVSVDGGRTWQEATLGAPLSEHAWTPWQRPWSPSSPGDYLLMARATDAAGHTQPLESSWNAQGYGNNVVQQVRVKVD